MSHPPWFPFLVDVWLGDPIVQEMSREEKGFYIDMLALAWKQDPRGSLPTSTRSLGRLLHEDPRRVRRILAGCIGLVWPEEDGRRVNKRLTQEAEKQQLRSDKARASVMARYPANVERSKNERATSIETETERHKKTPPTPQGVYSPEFEAFWKAWPNKKRATDIDGTFKKWNLALKAGVAPEQIMASLAGWMREPEWTKDGGSYIPGPKPWFNDKKYLAKFDTGPAPDSQEHRKAVEWYRREEETQGGISAVEALKSKHPNIATAVLKEVHFGRE